VLNPTSVFFDTNIAADPGTYSGVETTVAPGKAAQLITCADLTFVPGVWHFVAEVL
jgi:hypothetical protein